MLFDIYVSSSIAGGNGLLNERLCQAFEDAGFKCFLPQRDVCQDASPQVMAEADYQAIRESKVVLAIFKNASRNFFIELGFAHGIGRKIIGVVSPNDPIDVMTKSMDLELFRVSNTNEDDQYFPELVGTLREALKMEVKLDLVGIDWVALADVYERAPLGKREPAQLQRAFQSSFLTCVVLDQGKPVAAGRAISDGEYYINIYDVVVLPEYQGTGLGKKVVQSLLDRSKDRFVLLTTTMGKEDFNRTFGFRKHKTAMAIYPPSKQDKAKLYLEEE